MRPVKIHPLQLFKVAVVKIFVGFLIGSCILIMFIIAANKKADDQFGWVFNLAILMINDLVVIPLVYFIAQYLLIKLIEIKKIRQKPKLANAIDKFIDVGLKEIFVSDREHKRLNLFRKVLNKWQLESMLKFVRHNIQDL